MKTNRRSFRIIASILIYAFLMLEISWATASDCLAPAIQANKQLFVQSFVNSNGILQDSKFSAPARLMGLTRSKPQKLNTNKIAHPQQIKEKEEIGRKMNDKSHGFVFNAICTIAHKAAQETGLQIKGFNLGEKCSNPVMEVKFMIMDGWR